MLDFRSLKLSDSSKASLLCGEVFTCPIEKVDSYENLDIAAKMASNWNNRLLKECQSLSQEQNQPFIRKRTVQTEPEEVHTRPIIEAHDLINFIVDELTGHEFSIDELPFQIRTHSWSELRVLFQELDICYPQIGGDNNLKRSIEISSQIDDLIQKGDVIGLRKLCRQGLPASKRFKVWSLLLCARNLEAYLLSIQHAKDSRESVLNTEWLSDDVIRLDVAENVACNSHYFPFDAATEHLCLSLIRDDSLSIKHTLELTNDSIQSKIGYEANNIPLKSKCGIYTTRPHLLLGRTALLDEQTTSDWPPCGFIPLPNLALMAAPFALIHEDSNLIYPVFKTFYMRYLCRLHGLNSKLRDLPFKYPECTLQAQKRRLDKVLGNKDGYQELKDARDSAILSIFGIQTQRKTLNEQVDIFEEGVVRFNENGTSYVPELLPTLLGVASLIESYSNMFTPHLKFHLTVNLKISLLKATLPWVISAFTNVITPDQLLLLWDRIIGYDSVEIFALLCVAILNWKHDLLMSCKTEDDVRVALVDIGNCKVIELLQVLLFVSQPKESSI